MSHDDDRGAITRRALIGGLAAIGIGVAGVGAVGLGTNPGRRALHDIGLLDADDLAIPDTDVEDFTAAQPSSSLEWRVARTGATDEGPSFAIVCLHGRGADKDFAFDSIGVHRFAAVAGLDVVVAAIDGGTASYWHSRDGARDLDDRLTETIVNASAVAGGGPVAVMGWSMGGFGALRARAVVDAPVAAVVASSPAAWRDFDDAAGGAFDDRDDFERNVLFTEPRLDRLREIPVRIDCGADDPFEGIARDLLQRMPESEGGIRPGFHDAKFWRRLVPDQLRFLEAALNP